MPKSTSVSGSWLAFSVFALAGIPAFAADADAVKAACTPPKSEPDVQVVCPNQSGPPLPTPNPATCDPAQPNSWVPGCPLRTLDVLSAKNGVAEAAVAVAFVDYPRLTNANYQALTAQVDATVGTQELCDGVKGRWVPNPGIPLPTASPPTGVCLVRPRVRVEPKTLDEDTCAWCCGNHLDAIWKGQSVGSNAGCMVPSYVYHRGLLGVHDPGLGENLGFGEKLLERPARLRSYGFSRNRELSERCQADPLHCNDLHFGFPGWAIVLRKGSQPKPGEGLPNDGDRLALSLYNLMPPDEVRDEKCNPQSSPHPDDVYPACFHGNDVTNLHFHGSHVSPQLHQDDVLVNLKPLGSVDDGGHKHDGIFYGRYDIALDPLTWRQSEGTHWYHPHKHGSTALQVINGMAGPLIVKGPFDDAIDEQVFGAAHDQYRSSLAPQDKILVVQAIADEINLSARFDRWNTPWAMVNGQFQPVIRIQPGEVQRWRIIGATQDASAHIELFFAGTDLDVRQIAQDGVQLAPQNYAKDSQADDPDSFWKLAPGNRIDLLVWADPKKTSLIGKPLMMMSRPSQGLAPQALRQRFIGDSQAVFPLFSVVVCDPNDNHESGPPCQLQNMKMPDTLPDLPDYLRTIEDSEITACRTISFDQTADAAGASRDGAAEEKQVAKFRIDGKPYDPERIDQTMQIGRAEEWRIVNNTQMNHPLHIHINPFQVTAMKQARLVDAKANTWKMLGVSDLLHSSPDWPLWRDTLALPTLQTTSCVDPSGKAVDATDAEACRKAGNRPPTLTDGSPLPIGTIAGEVTLRQRFEDFTGEYVMHCHILGHEDRGMMQNLQTVCADGKPGSPASYWLDPPGDIGPPHGLWDTRTPECGIATPPKQEQRGCSDPDCRPLGPSCPSPSRR